MKKVGFLLFSAVAIFAAGFELGYQSRNRDVPAVKLVSVYDGDTLVVDIQNWPEIIGRRIPIRIRGIDTPELHDESAKVKALAVQAKEFSKEKLGRSQIRIQNLDRDKYFRIVADVYVDGQNLGDALIKNGLAKPYDGGKKPEWK